MTISCFNLDVIRMHVFVGTLKICSPFAWIVLTELINFQFTFYAFNLIVETVFRRWLYFDNILISISPFHLNKIVLSWVSRESIVQVSLRESVGMQSRIQQSSIPNAQLWYSFKLFKLAGNFILQYLWTIISIHFFIQSQYTLPYFMPNTILFKIAEVEYLDQHRNFPDVKPEVEYYNLHP